MKKCKNCFKEIPKGMNAVCSTKCALILKRKKQSGSIKAVKKTKKLFKKIYHHSLENIDALWSRLIKKRDGQRCVICGCRRDLEAHHLTSRLHMATRWLLENGVTLCQEHHTIGQEAAHRDKEAFEQKLIKVDNKYKIVLERVLILSKTVVKKDHDYYYEQLLRSGYDML